jgi:hypothetical protein
MKKVMFLIVGLFFSVSVNAATLSWNAASISAVEGWSTFESPSLITATKNFNLVNDGYTRTLTFNVADGPATVGGLVVETTDEQFDISSVTLDGNPLTFDAFASRWSLNSAVMLAIGSYDLVIDITSVVAGGLLNVQVNAINEVPVPAALLLFAPALLGFFGLRRKAAVAA